MDRSSRLIEKLGTLDIQIVEANPVVWQGRLYLFEYIRYFPGRDSVNYHGNDTGDSCFRFRDVENNTFTPMFASGLHLGCAFAAGDRMIVTAVNAWAGDRIYQMESTDLVSWTEPRVVLTDERWRAYNTSVCRAGDRYVMTFELGGPEDMVGIPFTMFFAESRDLINWTMIPDGILGKDFYTGGPMLRWYDGWFYFFYLEASTGPESYETVVVRSSDLKNWEWSSKNPVISYCPEEDKKILPDFPMQFAEYMLNADDFNASDLDMCDFNGDVQLVYSWGNQHGKEFLARAIVKNMTEEEFCKSFFP